MLGVVEDLVERALLHDAARVHHGDPVGDVGHHAEVVGHEDHRGAGLVAQLADALEDLRLDRHVERGGRLVGDQHARVAREGQRDHHALAHAARELERVGVDALARPRDADPLEQLDRALARLLVGQPSCAWICSTIWSPILQHRVQRRHRVLEDHRDLGSADPAQLVVAGADQLGALVGRAVPSKRGVRASASGPAASSR